MLDAKKHGYCGKTSYEMMMTIFGNRDKDKLDAKESASYTWLRNDAPRELIKKSAQVQKNRRLAT